MAHTNDGIITAPISLTNDVEAVIGTANHDLGTLCLKNNINFWARYRPTAYGRIKNRKKGDSTNENKMVMYGLATYDNNNNVVSKSINQLLPEVTISNNNFSSNLHWNIKPTLQYYRLQDFNGYNKNAKINYNFDFFKPRVRGNKTGVFYNSLCEILVLNKNTGYSSSVEPPQCWEEATGNDDYNYCSSLYFEELFDNVGIGGLYFGISFIIGSNSFTLSTGYTVNQLFNTNLGEQPITINNTDVGVIFSQAGRINLSIDFSKLNSVSNTKFINNGQTSDINIKARTVLINTGTSSAFICSPVNSIGTPYSFEVQNDFCVKNTTLKYLASYVNIIDVRNYGDFFSNIDDWVYRGRSNVYTNCDWYLKSGKTNDLFRNCCYLTSNNNKYKFQNNAFVVDANGEYVRYNLHLRGYINYEFRPKNRTLSDVVFIADSSQNAGETVSIQLVNNSGISIYAAQYNNTIVTNVNNEIVTIDQESFSWTYTNNNYNVNNSPYDYYNTYFQGSNQLRHCDKPYNEETGNFTFCSSGFLNLGASCFNGNSAFDDGSSLSYIYFYVPATAVSNRNAFKLNVIYNGVLYTYDSGLIEYRSDKQDNNI